MQGQSQVDAVCVVGDVDPWTHLILTLVWVGQSLGGPGSRTASQARHYAHLFFQWLRKCLSSV